jgi:hypothetical protein
MRRIYCYMGIGAVLLLGACDSNKKLGQAQAEKTIKAFASTHSESGIYGNPTTGDCAFNEKSIATIELSQFSETAASAVVALKCATGTLPVKFVFQRDIDNRWFLTKIDEVEGAGAALYYTGSANWIRRNQNLKVLAQ